MRDGSVLYFSDVARQQREEQMVCLLTITGDMPEAIRLAADTIDLTSRGFVFTGLPFGWRPPSQGEAQAPGQIVVQNVTKAIGETVRRARGPLAASLEVVLRSEPDTVIQDFRRLKLRDADVRGSEATFTLVARTHANAAWPGTVASPALTPGLWA